MVCSAAQPSASEVALDVTWSGPGQCVYYTVSWTGIVLWENDTDPGNNTRTREDTIAISDLVPYTDYTVTLHWDEEGGQNSEACLARTAEIGKRLRLLRLLSSSHQRKVIAALLL